MELYLGEAGPEIVICYLLLVKIVENSGKKERHSDWRSMGSLPGSGHRNTISIQLKGFCASRSTCAYVCNI